MSDELWGMFATIGAAIIAAIAAVYVHRQRSLIRECRPAGQSGATPCRPEGGTAGKDRSLITRREVAGPASAASAEPYRVSNKRLYERSSSTGTCKM
jgi:hypothetical protein